MAAVGAVVFVLIHLGLVLAWKGTFAHHGVDEAWFLNSGLAILATAVGLFVAALLVGLLVSSQKRWLTGALAMSTGVVLAMCTVKVVIGLGNLFPLVLAMGTVVTVPPVMLGMAAGMSLQKFTARRHEA